MAEMCRRFGVGLNEGFCEANDLTTEWSLFNMSLSLLKKALKKSLIDNITELFGRKNGPCESKLS